MKTSIVVAILFTSALIFAHGGHDEPGAIPPAPHGGVISEAKHHHGHSQHGHDHKKAKKKEIFFEAILKGNSLKVYPLILDPHSFKTFIPKVTKDFTNTKITVYDPRKKITHALKFTPEKSLWSTSFKNIKGRRFIIKVSSLLGKANYKAKIQVERK